MSRFPVEGFKHERLDQILAVRRLSQTQLASLLGISTGTVSKWRGGTQKPELETLERMATVLNVSPDWLTRPLDVSITPPLFRSNASALKASRSMLEGRLQWAEEVCIGLSQFVDFPELNLPERRYIDPDAITHEDIETAAEECRDLWRLGNLPIQDLALAAEGAGIILVKEETGIPTIEGLSSWSEHLGRFMVHLSADKKNAFRGRFDLAHEIGHCVLHKHIVAPKDRERHNLMEKQAHAFAGALLMPASTLSRDTPPYPSLAELLTLKIRWGASVAAIIMRLKALQLIDDNNSLQLFKRRSTRWGSRKEPFDDKRSPEQPRLLKRSIQLLHDEKIVRLDAFSAMFGLALNDLEMLTGLPRGYFNSEDNLISLSPHLRSDFEQKPSRSKLSEVKGCDVIELNRVKRLTS